MYIENNFDKALMMMNTDTQLKMTFLPMKGPDQHVQDEKKEKPKGNSQKAYTHEKKNVTNTIKMQNDKISPSAVP